MGQILKLRGYFVSQLWLLAYLQFTSIDMLQFYVLPCTHRGGGGGGGSSKNELTQFFKVNKEHLSFICMKLQLIVNCDPLENCTPDFHPLLLCPSFVMCSLYWGKSVNVCNGL